MNDSHTYCRKEKEIAEIHTTVKNMKEDVQELKKDVIGNGTGLKVTVPLLTLQVAQLNQNVERNNTLTSGVLKFKQELEGEDRGTSKEKRRSKWLIATLIGVVVTQLGMIITLIVSIVSLFNQ